MQAFFRVAYIPIMRLPNVDAIIMDIITRDRHYQIAKEDLDYLKSLKYCKK